jgi:hypothetical protein
MFGREMPDQNDGGNAQGLDLDQASSAVSDLLM